MLDPNPYRGRAPLQSLELSSDSESPPLNGTHERFFTANSDDLIPPIEEDGAQIPLPLGSSSSSLSQFSARLCPQSPTAELSRHVRTLIAKQAEFENEVQESLNVLTDRINGIEFECGERRTSCDSSIGALRSQMRSVFTELVRKIIKLVQLIPVSSKSGSRVQVQSRIGMSRTRIVNPRE